MAVFVGLHQLPRSAEQDLCPQPLQDQQAPHNGPDTRYGNVSKASVGAIVRRLLVLEQQGAQVLFGEPALVLADMMQTDEQGHGYVNILAADQLIHTPALYSTFLLWLLSELFETLPEVGDPDQAQDGLFLR